MWVAGIAIRIETRVMRWWRSHRLPMAPFPRADRGGAISAKDLTASTGGALLDRMLRRCSLQPDLFSEIVIAIDTPLGWPKAMIDLATGGPTVVVTSRDSENPYTRRLTELKLIEREHRPLSAVRDQLGSQSTKAIHFLRAAELRASGCGVWQSDESTRPVTAIETYPAAAIMLGRTAELHDQVIRQLDNAGRPLRAGAEFSDVKDALTCALVAYLHGEAPLELERAPAEASMLEGWIVLPIDESHPGRTAPQDL